mmetsp:Transcript_29218/g.41360  ORF Transcript_29218/g.41360 Transcript_29218/m.41360 type:complete len:563 (+) Transcript_29218:127-1815(+)
MLYKSTMTSPRQEESKAGAGSALNLPSRISLAEAARQSGTLPGSTAGYPSASNTASLHATIGNGNNSSSDSGSSANNGDQQQVDPNTLLKRQQNEQLLATRLLLQQQQTDEALLSNPLITSSLLAGANVKALEQAALNQKLTFLRAQMELQQPQAASSQLLQKAHQQLQQNNHSLSLPPKPLDPTNKNSDTKPSDNVKPAATDDKGMGEEGDEASANKKKQEYYDASTIPDPPEDDEDEQKKPKGGIIEPFPQKLYRMIEECEKDGTDDIVSFFSHGRAFCIHKPRKFISDIMSKYFSTTRMSSFQRQLNLYGFRRITEGRDKGGYFHEFFLKGRKALCKKIQRKKTNAPPAKLQDVRPNAIQDAANLFQMQMINQGTPGLGALGALAATNNPALGANMLRSSLAAAGLAAPSSALPTLNHTDLLTQLQLQQHLLGQQQQIQMQQQQQHQQQQFPKHNTLPFAAEIMAQLQLQQQQHQQAQLLSKVSGLLSGQASAAAAIKGPDQATAELLAQLQRQQLTQQVQQQHHQQQQQQFLLQVQQQAQNQAASEQSKYNGANARGA